MSRVTLPIEKGYEELVLELIKLWGADAIRNSDGTKLNDYFKNLDAKIYSTYFGTREDQEWPRKNPKEIQNIALMSEKVVSNGESLEIELLAKYYKEQFAVNEDSIDYWQVFDRTENKEISKEDWKYKNGKVLIKTKSFHEYSVNFFAWQLWDVTHMYNHITNSWTGDKSIPYDAVYENTREHIYKDIDNWCKRNPNVDVVRFTTFFYHFTVMYNEKILQKFGDWFGYSASVSPKLFENFKKDRNIDITLENIIDQGFYNNQFRNPCPIYLEFLDYMQEFVSSVAKKCVEIVHNNGKEAIMFVGDNWIGTEPYGKYFKNINLDGVAGSAECGVDIRMVADMEDIRIKEIRFLPYLFPDTFYEGNKPHLEWEYNWMRSRRAILSKKVDRMGFGGYLSLAAKFPKFIDGVKKSCDEFRQIHDNTPNEESKKLKSKVAILNSWGKLKSWQCNRTGHASGIKENYSYIGLLEILSGLPYDISFINFEDVKDYNKLKEYKVIINVGSENTSFSGGKNWLDIKVLENIRRFVAEGNVFVGIGDPSASLNNSSYFQLSDVLGIDKEVGNTLQYSRYYNKENLLENRFNVGLDKKYIYPTNDSVEILQLDDHFGIEVSINNYFKGKGVYLQGLVYSIENTRKFFELLLKVTKEEYKYLSDNENVEVYEFEKYYAVINNSDKSINTSISNLGEISLEKYELKWIGK